MKTSSNSLSYWIEQESFLVLFSFFVFPREVLEAIPNGPVVALPAPKSL
jgi:hypothetical protein